MSKRAARTRSLCESAAQIGPKLVRAAANFSGKKVCDGDKPHTDYQQEHADFSSLQASGKVKILYKRAGRSDHTPQRSDGYEDGCCEC
jgi:hypothetical protein